MSNQEDSLIEDYDIRIGRPFRIERIGTSGVRVRDSKNNRVAWIEKKKIAQQFVRFLNSLPDE